MFLTFDMKYLMKEMILIEEVDNKEYLTELFKAIYDDLPTPKKKK